MVEEKDEGKHSAISNGIRLSMSGITIDASMSALPPTSLRTLLLFGESSSKVQFP